MKVVDMDTVELVHSGDVWPHEMPPCCKKMIRFLEKNEGMVTWVQPKQGSVKDQYPVIRVNKEYYTMSLRMMKAVWRHVRLRKGFVNIERAPYGGQKLCIPSQLYVEKMRTQSRFNLMRMETSKDPQGSRVLHNATSKVNLVVHRMLLPLVDMPMRPFIEFEAGVDVVELDLIDHLREKNPTLMEDRAGFVEYLKNLFDRYKRLGYEPVLS